MYSNFPSKRALYLAVLLDQVEEAGTGPVPAPPPGPAAAPALGTFARAWLERLPLVDDQPRPATCNCARWPGWSMTSRPGPRWPR